VISGSAANSLHSQNRSNEIAETQT
jgi:hypothetical protein